MIKVRKGSERGHTNLGWLDAYHSFSFGDYHDREWAGYRSLRVINDDLVMPGGGFGMHPHRDMEIITYILSGAIEHKDSLGNGRVIRAGEFQYMAAGTGVMHSEFNPLKDEAAHLLQIWIRPEANSRMPRYEERSARDEQLSLIASKTGREDSIAINQDAELWLAKLGAGEEVSHELGDGRHAFVHVAEGEISLNDTKLSGGDAAAITAEKLLGIRSAKDSRVLIFDLN